MIKLDNINISFSHDIIIDGQIVLKEGNITIINGESGSGKTSLLNLIGLISDNKSCDYYVNDKKLDLNDKDVVNNFIHSNISYVLQNNYFFEDFSIEDNFKIFCDMYKIKYTDCLLEELLSKVNINNNRKTKVKKLSGGEKQRLSIALALVKNPVLMLFDEPTANLDPIERDNIINILYELKGEGRIIVISTHHHEYYNADVMYEIEDCHIKCIKDSEDIGNNSAFFEKSNNLLFYVKYCFRNILHNRYAYIFMTILLSVCLALFSKVIVVNIQLRQAALKSYNLIGNNELFVVRELDTENENDSSIKSRIGYFNFDKYEITQEEINKIKEIKHVEEVYPYMVFSNQDGVFYNADGLLEINNNSKLNSITVKKDNNIINNCDLGNNFISLISTGENIVDQTIELNETEKNGIFISTKLAKILNIEKIDDISLEFELCIPIGSTEGKITTLDEKLISKIRNPECVLVKLEYPISGIIASESNNYYDGIRDLEIYMDYQQMIELQEQVIEDNQDIYNKIQDWWKLKNIDDEFLTKDYNSCALIVKSDNYKNNKVIEENIKKIFENVTIKTKSHDIERINQLYLHSIISNSFMEGTVLLALVILISIIYWYKNKKDINKLVLIRASGLTNTLFINLIEILTIFMFIQILSAGIVFYLMSVYKFKNILGNIIVINFLISLVIIIPILVMCFIQNNRLKVENILRGI